MSEPKRIILQAVIPFSSKHVFLALEEDRLDHAEQVLQIDGIQYGIISRRLETHRGYGSRGPDALEAIYEALPGLIGLDAGILRDGAAGCIIY
jgi:hypothetical protein